jgi:hypothetical protein
MSRVKIIQELKACHPPPAQYLPTLTATSNPFQTPSLLQTLGVVSSMLGITQRAFNVGRGIVNVCKGG